MPLWHPPPLATMLAGTKFNLGVHWEFTHVAKAFALLALALAFSEMVNALLALHPSTIDSPSRSDSLLDFWLDLDLKLSMDFFRLIFLCMFHLLVAGSSGMVFEHLQAYFDHEDLTHGFIQFH